MVVKDSKSLFSLIEQFDPNNKDHLSQFRRAYNDLSKLSSIKSILS